MIVKILGALDITIAFLLFLLTFNVEIPFPVLLIMMVVLAAKSLPFLLSFDLGSIIDVAAALFILINFFVSLPVLLFLIAAFAVGQKGVVSLL